MNIPTGAEGANITVLVDGKIISGRWNGTVDGRIHVGRFLLDADRVAGYAFGDAPIAMDGVTIFA